MSSFYLDVADKSSLVRLNDFEHQGEGFVRIELEGAFWSLRVPEARMLGRQLLAFAEYLEGTQRTGQVAKLLRKVDEL